jgi:hypothetical protein
MKFLAAAGLAGACLATSPVIAADLFDSGPPPLDAPAPEAEFGSNWYIRGDVGYGQNNESTVVPSAGLFPTVGNAPIGDAANPVPITRGNNQTNMGPNFGLGFGYRVNDWFRAEATYTFTPGPGLGTTQTVYCPESANAVSNYTFNAANPNGIAVPVGYQYDYTKCDGTLNVKQYNNTALAMGYFDLGHWGIFSPFIGVGGGMNVNSMSGSLTFTQQDTGANYTGATVTGSAPGVWVTSTGKLDANGNPIYAPIPRPTVQSGVNQPIGAANWTRNINTTKYTIAASAAAGVGIQISQSATLDIGYHITTLDLFGGTKSLLQSVNLGVRYNLN